MVEYLGLVTEELHRLTSIVMPLLLTLVILLGEMNEPFFLVLFALRLVASTWSNLDILLPTGTPSDELYLLAGLEAHSEVELTDTMFGFVEEGGQIGHGLFVHFAGVDDMPTDELEDEGDCLVGSSLVVILIQIVDLFVAGILRVELLDVSERYQSVLLGAYEQSGGMDTVDYPLYVEFAHKVEFGFLLQVVIQNSDETFQHKFGDAGLGCTDVEGEVFQTGEWAVENGYTDLLVVLLEVEDTGNCSHRSTPQHYFNSAIYFSQVGDHTGQILRLVHPQRHILPFRESTPTEIKHHERISSLQHLLSVSHPLHPRPTITVQIDDYLVSILQLLEPENTSLDLSAEFVPQGDILSVHLSTTH